MSKPRRLPRRIAPRLKLAISLKLGGGGDGARPKTQTCIYSCGVHKVWRWGVPTPVSETLPPKSAQATEIPRFAGFALPLIGQVCWEMPVWWPAEAAATYLQAATLCVCVRNRLRLFAFASGCSSPRGCGLCLFWGANASGGQLVRWAPARPVEHVRGN